MSKRADAVSAATGGSVECGHDPLADVALTERQRRHLVGLTGLRGGRWWQGHLQRKRGDAIPPELYELVGLGLVRRSGTDEKPTFQITREGRHAVDPAR